MLKGPAAGNSSSSSGGQVVGVVVVTMMGQVAGNAGANQVCQVAVGVDFSFRCCCVQQPSPVCAWTTCAAACKKQQLLRISARLKVIVR